MMANCTLGDMVVLNLDMKQPMKNNSLLGLFKDLCHTLLFMQHVGKTLLLVSLEINSCDSENIIL